MPTRRIALIAVILLTLALLATTVNPAQAQQRIHVVQPGETMYSIARQYGVTVQQISAANGIVNPALIYVGQQLVIPGTGSPPPSGSTTTYTVASGDTLYSIARRFNTDVNTLIQLNGLTNPNVLYVGQVLLVPSGETNPTPEPTQATEEPTDEPTEEPTATPPPEQITHTVQPGETLSRIALQYGVTVQQIVQLNNISNPNLIYVGQVLVIRSGPAPTPAPTATAGPTNTPAPTNTPTATPVPGRITHTVQRGETLSRIALQYGVSVQQIVQLNNITNPNLIYPGQVLVIQEGPAPTATPTNTPRPTDTPRPTNTPTPTRTPRPTSTQPTPTDLPDDIPTPTPIVPAASVPGDSTNLLDDGGFEGDVRRVAYSNILVFEGWEPYYCAEPYTSEPCPAPRQGTGNPTGLEMGRPEYGETTTANRVHSGSSAQVWACRYVTCQAGIYQTIDTTPGATCEVGAFVQSYSTHGDGLTSDLSSQEDRNNSTWTINVDRDGGTNGFSTGSNMISSESFGYDEGIYDEYAAISYTFVATGTQTTIFIEDQRIWPFTRNFSYVDDAYVRCTTP